MGLGLRPSVTQFQGKPADVCEGRMHTVLRAPTTRRLSCFLRIPVPVDGDRKFRRNPEKYRNSGFFSGIYPEFRIKKDRKFLFQIRKTGIPDRK
jgi:hypothetical protein